MHGEMRYMERQVPKRMNPGLILSNAGSLVVTAMNYHTGHSLSDQPLKGKISRYAWGDDYHVLIKNRLDRLLDFIKRQAPSAQGLTYVDTGPVMEKAWGAQTTLGWIGKHTNLIAREQGSWFFVGVILLNIDLDYDAPGKDHCGKCSRCIQACPTGAIVAPYVLDARLCISYLTIELRGPIPTHLRPLIGNRIYGCDDCQEICPWNRFAVKTPEMAFSPREENLMPELLSLVRITPPEFKRRFENSPVLRATRDGFVRNVVVALGNSGSNEAVPALKEALQDPSPLVRIHAEWALERIANYE
jgi:epoxyqueuosine reductase